MKRFTVEALVADLRLVLAYVQSDTFEGPDRIKHLATVVSQSPDVQALRELTFFLLGDSNATRPTAKAVSRLFQVASFNATTCLRVFRAA